MHFVNQENKNFDTDQLDFRTFEYPYSCFVLQYPYSCFVLQYPYSCYVLQYPYSCFVFFNCVI